MTEREDLTVVRKRVYSGAKNKKKGRGGFNGKDRVRVSFEKVPFKQLFNSSLSRDARRTVEKSLPRFISVIAIVALGMSFFAGMNATSPDMLKTAQSYYEETNLCDLCVQSTVGISNSEVNAITRLSGVEAVMPVKTVDGILTIGGESLSDVDGSAYTVRVMSLDVDKAYGFGKFGEDDPSYMNRITLLDGSWPAATNECLVDASRLSTPDEFKIGQTIKIEADRSDLSTKLNTTEYKIVGIIRSPLFVSYERGYTTVGTGKLGTFIYVPQECFTLDYYTAAYVKVSGSENYRAYTKDYDKYVSSVKPSVESLGISQLGERVDDLYNEYYPKVTQGKAEYEQLKAKAELELENGKKQVEETKYLAQNGDQLVQKLKQQYNEAAVATDNQIGMAQLERTSQYAEWEEKMAKYNEAKALVDQYADAETKYNNALTTYNVAKTTVETSYTTVTTLEEAVKTGRAAIDQLNNSQDESASDIIERIKSISYGNEELNNIINDIKSLTAVGTAEEIADFMEPELQKTELKLTAAKLALDTARKALLERETDLKNAEALLVRLKQLRTELAATEIQLNDAKSELDNAEYQIQFSQQEAVNQLLELKTQISSYEIQVPLAKEKALTIDAEYSEKENLIKSQLDLAKYRIEEAEKTLNGLSDASWIVSDRDSCVKGYTEYRQTADRTAALSRILPWFFFLVAAFVSLNTMTRMVEEERTQIGTLKALGFVNGQILVRYLIYAVSASLLGCIFGISIGFCVFPLAITKAYGILYDLPSVILDFKVLYAVIGTLIAVGTTSAATFFAVKNSLSELPASLMRPKAPEDGGRIFLENKRRIWSRLSFSTKLAMRNIFRSPKRVAMVVIGVAGCTALLVAGFGLSDSIKASLNNQFEGDSNICRYDVQLALKNDILPDETDNSVLSVVSSRQEIERSDSGESLAMLTYMRSSKATSEKNENGMEINLVVPENPEKLNYYINLEKKGKRSGQYSNSGCVITDKLASTLHLSVGDTIVLEDDGKSVDIPVTGIVKNYTFHYVYLTPKGFSKYFGRSPGYNFITAVLFDGITNEQKTSFAQDMMTYNDISAVAYTSDTVESLNYILTSLNYVVLVIIVAAALLAFIVLYNLSNINITERLKEIATLKVLGFNKNEVSEYISRENRILSIIGTLCGIILGIPLHRLVIALAEVDVVRFGRIISPVSFLYAVVLSLVFAEIVNFVMRRHLKKIDMVNTLKSVE